MPVSETLVEQLRELHAMEAALMPFLPKMVLAGSSVQFRALVATHLKETEGQVARLDKISKHIGKSLKGKSSTAMSGLLDKIRPSLQLSAAPLAKDIALLHEAQRIEQAEIAAYQAAAALARQEGAGPVVVLLEKTEKEEEAAHRLLGALAGEMAAGSIQATPSP
ncbi:MAG TPA: DUF892 family protein [Opitutaceae bacterium]|nr:DUF892 family protein [Opitutaceae bacterium]